MSFEPVVLFFLLGVVAGLLRNDLKIPGSIYEALSIFILLAIGLKGGVVLSKHPVGDLLASGLVVVLVGALIPLVAFPILRYLGRMSRANAASIAAHYGSVSVVTFSVGIAMLGQEVLQFEGFMVVFMVLLEIPALVIGVILARHGQGNIPWSRLMHDALFGKSIFLLVGGLLIGWVAGDEGIKPLDKLFFDLFKGVLAMFLLEMGLVASSRIADLRSYGAFLILFAMGMPLFSAALGIVTGWSLGLSVGGTFLLALLYASASYIAAPAAMRIAVPEANPALSIGASLGITFPFNIFLGAHIYLWMARWIHTYGA